MKSHRFRWLKHRFGGSPVAAITQTDGTPIIPANNSTIDLGGAQKWPAPSNTTAIYDLRGTTGVTIKNGILDGLNQCPVFLTDASTSGLTLIDLTCRNGGSGVSFETVLMGGTRTSQTGGGHTVTGCRFEYMRLALAGIGHILTDCTFYKSPYEALKIGAAPLDWGAPNANAGNNLQIVRPIFDQCYTSGNTDDGCLYVPKTWVSDGTITNPTFTNCGSIAYYVDDMAANWSCTGATWTNCYQDFLMGGGVNLTLSGTSTNATVKSVWDDRGSYQNGTGGTHSNTYSNGAWHAVFHSLNAWTHGAVSGAANASMGRYTTEHGQIVAGGAEAWLARINSLLAGTSFGSYAGLYGSDATYGTQGSIAYSYSGTTPAPTNGYGTSSLVANCHAGVTGTINGISAAPPPSP